MITLSSFHYSNYLILEIINQNWYQDIIDWISKWSSSLSCRCLDWFRSQKLFLLFKVKEGHSQDYSDLYVCELDLLHFLIDTLDYETHLTQEHPTNQDIILNYKSIKTFISGRNGILDGLDNCSTKSLQHKFLRIFASKFETISIVCLFILFVEY